MANVALLLGISPSRISVVSVKKGSVVVDMNISPTVPVTNSKTVLGNQVNDITFSLAILTVPYLIGC